MRLAGGARNNKLFTSPRSLRLILHTSASLKTYFFGAPTDLGRVFASHTNAMESITPTDEFEPARPAAARTPDLSDAPTEVHRPVADVYRGAGKEQRHSHQPSPVIGPPGGRERCVGCGAPLASDQRYCVECGQRLGRARLPFMEETSRYERPAAAGDGERRARVSANTALIASIGTLLLAMGVGVLIGRGVAPARSGNGAPVQYLTVPGANPTTGAAPGATGSEPQSTVAGATTGSSKTTGSPAGKGGKTAAKPAAKALPPAKVVTVGSSGKGPGYQKGKFTGNFFGEGEE